MPTYEYQCANGHTFELFQRMSDKPKAKCPECGAAAGRRISGGAGLIFKGSGFYITDYGKDGKGPRKPESAESSGESSAKPESKPAAEAKPDAKSKAAKPKSKKATE